MKYEHSIRRELPAVLALVMTVMTAAMPASANQRGPEELRGKVTSMTGERIHIGLDQKEWLPRESGTKVSLGAEMGGMFVPLKGSFVIIQVNADSVIAMGVGSEERGTPAAGMLAVIQTPYPNHPQRRVDYMAAADVTRQPLATVLSMAQGGDSNAQHLLAMGYKQIGDNDNALSWWQKANRGAAHPTVIGNSAMGMSSILENRGDYGSAAAVLKEAVARTMPNDGEKTFEAYRASLSKIYTHISVLKDLGYLYRSKLNHTEESKRWYRDAATLLGAVAGAGAPGPGHPQHVDQLNLLMDLAGLYEYALEDPEGAVPWLQKAAREGHTYAQKKLMDKGLGW